MGGAPFWYYTLDTGNRWSTLLVADSALIYDVKFTDPYHGWAVGYSGVILKYNSSLIGMSNNNYNVPDSYKLNQNYPNPFNPSTTIRYNIPRLGRVRITVYDLTGRELKILLDKIQNIGDYNIRFFAADLASGVYFYKLEAGEFTETRKMVLLR